MSIEVGEKLQENKMGVMPVNKLLLEMSLPMMASMLVQALYNIVDSIFVAKLSENALTAVSLAFPIQTLLIAVGAGTGVGVNALLSKQLGEKDYKRIFNNDFTKEVTRNSTCSNLFIFVHFMQGFLRSSNLGRRFAKKGNRPMDKRNPCNSVARENCRYKRRSTCRQRRYLYCFCSKKRKSKTNNE